MKLSKGFIFAFSATFIWAISIIITRIILKSEANAYNIVFWTAILSFPYWLRTILKQKKEIKKLEKQDLLILFGIGMISTIFVSVFEFLALKYSPAANFSFLYRSVTIFTVIFAYVFLKEKITSKKIVLVILILIGSYFITANGTGIKLTTGDIFTLLEAACAAFGNNVLGKMATNRMNVNLPASGGYMFGIIPLFLFLYYKQAIFLPKAPVLIIILTLGAILVEQFRYRAYKYSNASFVTLVFSLTPVFVSFIAVVFLKETLTSLQIIGGIIIVTAGIFVEKLKI